jgi:hypothetical protein
MDEALLREIRFRRLKSGFGFSISSKGIQLITIFMLRGSGLASAIFDPCDRHWRA